MVSNNADLLSIGSLLCMCLNNAWCYHFIFPDTTEEWLNWPRNIYDKLKVCKLYKKHRYTLYSVYNLSFCFPCLCASTYALRTWNTCVLMCLCNMGHTHVHANGNTGKRIFLIIWQNFQSLFMFIRQNVLYIIFIVLDSYLHSIVWQITPLFTILTETHFREIAIEIKHFSFKKTN